MNSRRSSCYKRCWEEQATFRSRTAPDDKLSKRWRADASVGGNCRFKVPEKNGFEFIVRVREQPRFQNLPLFVLTAKALSGHDFEALLQSTKAIFFKTAIWREDLVSQLRTITPMPSIASGK